MAGGDELVAFLQVAGNDGNDFNTVVETLAKGDGYSVGGAVLVGEDVTVVAARQFQHALVGYHDGVDLAQGKGGADKHAGTYLLTTIGDVELSLEGVAGGVDGGIDNLDGGREGLVGIDVAVDVHFHALLDEGIVGLGDVDDGFESADLGEGEDGRTGVHLAVLVVLGTDDTAELRTDKGVLILEALGLHQLVIAGFCLVVYLLADAAGGLEGGHAVKLGLGAGKVDTGGVELGLVHADKHGAFLHTAADLDIDMFDVAGDAG